MSQRLSNLFQIATFLFLSWTLFSRVGQFSNLLFGLLFLFVAMNVVLAWFVAAQSPLVGRVCGWPIVRQYVRFVCSCMGEPEPNASGAKRILLQTKADFMGAATRAIQAVRGHDVVVNAALARIHESVTLRKNNRKAHGQGPLASFMLAGPNGIGKLYLLRVLSKLLYASGSTEVFDCRQLSLHDVVGGNNADGPLYRTLAKQPARMIVFENIEAASDDLAALFVQILKTGNLKSNNSVVSLQDATIAFITTLTTESVEELWETGRSENSRRLIDWLVSERQIHAPLLHSLTEVYLCDEPDDYVKCEVITLLMQKECRTHSTDLDFVDPTIVATQVVQVDEANGFALAPQRISKLMRKPLVAAVDGNHESLSLRVRSTN